MVNKAKAIAALRWVEKERPELLLDMLLTSCLLAAFMSISMSGLTLLLGLGILKSFGAFLVFGMFGFVFNAWRKKKSILNAYDEFTADNPDKA